jgi:formylmethanofuran dehydrogenase subunit E
MNIQFWLEKSARNHAHLCPRQVLGVRIGLAGLAALGFAAPPANKRLLAISETDGCFVDGLLAATDCAVGHRTLRVEDYGKVAATLIDTETGRALRIAPTLDARARACAHAIDESKRYAAQLQAYQRMPDSELLTIAKVELTTPLAVILSRPGLRVNCDRCGEEVMNEREIHDNGLTLCRPCARGGYYFSTNA